MKRIYSLILCLVIMLSLTGCCEEQKNELQKIIDTQIKSEESYTPASFDKYEEALNNAKTVKDKTFITAGTIDEAKATLESAIDELYEKPDKTPLKNKLDEAKQIDVSLYLPNSTPQFNTTITNATQTYENENAVIEDVNTAINELNNGIQTLVIKPDKTALNSLLTKARNLDKNKYTTVSCNKLETVIASTSTITNNENATQTEVEDAKKELNDCINGMAKAKKGVYKITCSLRRLATNHVGNDWSSGITYNGKSIHSGDTITASLNGSITITGTAIEHDSIPDSGSGSVSISLNGGEKSIQFYVRENRGRYAGNLAVWELTCSATLIERI